MTNNSTSSGDSSGSAALDSALADIENAMVRFERILARHSDAMQKAHGSNITKKMINNSLTRMFGIAAGLPRTGAGTQNPSNTQKNNRFPASSGQFLADLASSIRNIGGRNL
jgi:hypothetical protein